MCSSDLWIFVDSTSLMIAARNGEITDIKKELRKSTDVNEENKYGVTPLIHAAKGGKIEAARILIEAGADVNRCAEYNMCPLWFAVNSGSIEVVKLLLDRGAKADAVPHVNALEGSPLNTAAAENRPDIIQILLQHGASVSQENERTGTTALTTALIRGSSNALESLLRLGANPLEATKKIHVYRDKTAIEEAKRREEFSVKSSFFNSSIKHYKLMQNNSLNSIQKKEIDEKIEELTLKIKEVSKKTEYKEFSSVITIKNEDIKKIVKSFGDKDIFYNLLGEDSIIPDYQHTIETTKEIRKGNPLGFIIPHIISKKDSPIIKHSLEEQIFDFKIRQNILIGIKISSVMIQMILEEIKKECKINSLKEAKKLISETPEIEDIKEILDRGVNYVLGEPKDFIAGIHIVTPYFEELIRKILVKAGKKDIILTDQKNKYFRSIELGGLLKSEIVKDLIGENFQNTLRV